MCGPCHHVTHGTVRSSPSCYKVVKVRLLTKPPRALLFFSYNLSFPLCFETLPVNAEICLQCGGCTDDWLLWCCLLGAAGTCDRWRSRFTEHNRPPESAESSNLCDVGIFGKSFNMPTMNSFPRWKLFFFFFSVKMAAVQNKCTTNVLCSSTHLYDQ